MYLIKWFSLDIEDSVADRLCIISTNSNVMRYTRKYNGIFSRYFFLLSVRTHVVQYVERTYCTPYPVRKNASV